MFDPFDPNAQARARTFFGAANGQPLPDAGAPWGAAGPLGVGQAPPPPAPPPVEELQGAPMSPPVPASMPEPAGMSVAPPMTAAVPAPAEPSPQPAARPAAPMQGGGGGMGVDARGARVLGTYDAEKDAIQRKTVAEISRDQTVAQDRMVAEQQHRDGLADQAQADKEAGDQFNREMSELRAERAKIAEMKVDPKRLMKSDPSLAVGAIIGGALGGFFQGMTGGRENQVLSMIERKIDKDVSEQERLINERKGANVASMNALSELRSKYKDERTASLQLKSLQLESIKSTIDARAQALGTDVARANADTLLAGIDRKQAELDRQMAEERKRAAAAAAAAKAAAALRERQQNFENSLKLAELDTKRMEAGGKMAEKADKDAARFVATGQDKDGKPTGFLARSPEEAAKKEAVLTSGADILNNIDRALKVREETGIVGRTLNREGALGLWTPEWQTKMRSISTGLTLSLKNLEQAGALDKGMQEIAGSIIGDLESRGSTSDERLREFRERVKARLDAVKQGAAGQVAAKTTDEAGNERVQRARSYYAPPPSMPASVRRK